jgi:biotin synthase
VVFQSGEDPGLETDLITRIVSRIKERTDLAVALSLGERTEDDLAVWRRAGADRYLLKFETSDRELYRAVHLHPPGRGADRFEMLEGLRVLGYEIGSGIMIGIPGQTYDSIADDLILFQKYDLDMIAVGPFIPHPDTPLGNGRHTRAASEGEQAPNTERMVKKVLALTRILCPRANIPSTSALSALHGGMRGVGLSCGANVVMPNVTPMKYRLQYDIYPGKSSRSETDDADLERIIGEIRGMGREVGRGRGGRIRA